MLALPLGDPDLLRSQAFIAGQWQAGPSQHVVCNPATGQSIAHVARVSAEQVKQAISGAHEALATWKAQAASERAAVLSRLHALLQAHEQDLAVLITSEMGKPLAEARAEVRYAAGFVAWFAQEARRIYGSTQPGPGPGEQLIVTREAVGVCAAITPWNFPCAMITRKLAAALAAGCSFVLKPAEATPLSALALGVLCERAGVPAGVVSILTGAHADAAMIGREFTQNPLVAKLTFTGSTSVGRQLYAQAAASLKRVSLELGGNAPFIVFDDADLHAAVSGALHCKFRNAGQTCVSANRFLVQRTILPEFCRQLQERISALKLGPGQQPGVHIGPLISEAAVAKVERHVADAVQRGAQLLCGGKRSSLGGTFYEPTLLSDVSPDALLCQEETFGPVAALLPFDTEAQAVQLANATSAGLVAYFYTQHHARIWRLGPALQFGMLGVNSGSVSSELVPFGGIKDSGFGREGSRHGLDDYLAYKAQVLGGLAATKG